MDCDLGGTEVYEPLKWVLEQPIIEGYLRQVFLITDGEVHINKKNFEMEFFMVFVDCLN